MGFQKFVDKWFPEVLVICGYWKFIAMVCIRLDCFTLADAFMLFYSRHIDFCVFLARLANCIVPLVFFFAIGDKRVALSRVESICRKELMALCADLSSI